MRSPQKGAVMIVVAMLLPPLLGLAALAVDVLNLLLIRGELQNAADATALAGAACLNARPECNNSGQKTPDWAAAAARVLTFLPNNKVRGVTLSAAKVETGYWSVASPSWGLLPANTAPSPSLSPTIQVTLEMKDGVNGGAVPSLFAAVWGAPNTPMAVRAAAAITSPSTAAAGTVFPLAIAKCMYDTYWDAAAGQPKTAQSVLSPGFDLPQTVGQPFLFKVTSLSKVGTCQTGAWSSLDVSNPAQGASKVQWNSTPLSVGQLTPLLSGTKDSIYKSVSECSASGTKACEFVLMPVVDSVASNTVGVINGWACVRVVSASSQGTDKYVAVQMVNSTLHCDVTSMSGTGPGYGVLMPSRLVY